MAQQKIKIEDFKRELLKRIGDGETQQKIINAITEYCNNKELTKEEIIKILENAKENSDNIADTLTDIYTSNLLKWYLESVERINYLTDAIQEYGTKEGFKALSIGQYLFWKEMIEKVINEAEELLKEI